MKIEIWDEFGITGKMVLITFNTGIVIKNNKKILQKSSIGPMEISNDRFNQLKTMYQDDVTNNTDNLYQLIKSKLDAVNPKTVIILGDNPELDQNGVLIDQALNPQLDI